MLLSIFACGLLEAALWVTEIIPDLFKSKSEREDSLHSIDIEPPRKALISSGGECRAEAVESRGGGIELRRIAPSGQCFAATTQIIDHGIPHADKQRTETDLECSGQWHDSGP